VLRGSWDGRGAVGVGKWAQLRVGILQELLGRGQRVLSAIFSVLLPCPALPALAHPPAALPTPYPP